MSTAAILVTGVAKRLGLHLAKTFLGRGVPVIGTYRSDRPSLEALRDAGATLYPCDFHDDQQVDALITSIKENHANLRAIVHNASDWLVDDCEGLTRGEVMERMMRVHVSVPYQLNLALSPLLSANQKTGADIIHVGDYVSSRGSQKHIAYAASKAAQDNLTLSFAARLAPAIKVNSVAPSLVLFNDHDDDAYRSRVLNKNLMKREAGLDEFQGMIDYLLQSRYVTGRIMPLDGGRHLC